MLVLLSKAALRALFVKISDEDVQSLYSRLQKTSTQVDLIDKTLQSRGFSATYSDPYDQVNDFIMYVRECSVCYSRKPNYFLAPYITVVQSSGYGKTRLLLEASQLSMCTKTATNHDLIIML